MARLQAAFTLRRLALFLLAHAGHVADAQTICFNDCEATIPGARPQLAPRKCL